MNVKHLDFGTKAFIANGNRYYITEEIPIARFREFQRLKILIRFGSKDEQGLFADFLEIFNQVNGNDIDRSKVLAICQNNMHSTRNAIDKQYHAILQLCALFINRENEDATKFDKGYNDMKIADWEAEGFAITDFFHLANRLLQNSIDDLSADLLNFSQKRKAVTDKLINAKKK